MSPGCRLVTRLALPFAPPRTSPALLPRGPLLFLFRRHRLAKREDRRPVELDVGMLLFDGPDGFLVQRGPAHDHTRGRAIPVEDSRGFAGIARVKQEGVLVPAAIASQAEKRH